MLQRVSGLTHSPQSTRIVVIDGPGGAGKTTVAKRVAAHFGMSLLDTGAIYRSVALEAKRQGMAWDDGPKLGKLARSIKIEFRATDDPADAQRVLVDGNDVTSEIRLPAISDGASRVSAFPEVRNELLEIQREIAHASLNGCVAEGRDMGTVVFPDASYKFFLTASSTARAKRRHLELEQRGGSAPSLEQVAADLEERDRRDSSRASAPLSQAHDAVLVDSSDRGAEEIVALIIGCICQK